MFSAKKFIKIYLSFYVHDDMMDLIVWISFLHDPMDINATTS